MSFVEAMKQEVSNQLVETENGALGYMGTGKKNLDFFYRVSSYRSMDEHQIMADFAEAWNENKLIALKLLFFVGDIRGGLGERRTFKLCLKWLADFEPEYFKKIISLIPEYSRWDVLVDLLFIQNSSKNEIAEIIAKQFYKDLKQHNECKPISLLAKWLPSINTSSKDTVAKANYIAKNILHLTPKEYRKSLASMRKWLDVVEVKTCGNKWNEIDYEKVPSKANLKYSNAFKNHDEVRRKEYLKSLAEGKAKINSSVAFPYDIVHKYAATIEGTYDWGRKPIIEEDPTLEAMWKALPDYVNGESNTICVVDCSGSMTVKIGSSGVSALSIAHSLGIYLSERMSGEFGYCFITFSRHPEIVDYDRDLSLCQRLNIAYSHSEIANTDIEATFNLILNTAKKHNMKQKDIPQNILILSDMEFDCAKSGKADVALFEELKQKFIEAGYKMPRLIFWNLNSKTCAVPLKENENGVLLVSGFSPVIMKMVVSGELDPFKALIRQLNTERYDAVEQAVKE